MTLPLLTPSLCTVGWNSWGHLVYKDQNINLSERSPIILYNLSVVSLDPHTQEEPFNLLRAAPKLVLRPNIAGHCHNHREPLVVKEGRAPTGSTKKQAQEEGSPMTISDL